MSDEDTNPIDISTTESPQNESTPRSPSAKVLSGADNLYDGSTHVGVAIEVAASGKVSHLMIPDATRINEGHPIYITAPVTLEGKHLEEFLKNKGVSLPKPFEGIFKDAKVSCEALYFSTEKIKEEDSEIENGPLLMMFEIIFKKGLISTLSEDEALGNLFDVNSVRLRVLRCPASKRPIIEKYVRELIQD